jgi:basic type II keratin
LFQVTALKKEFDRKLSDAAGSRDDVRQLKSRVEVLTRALRERDEEAQKTADRLQNVEMMLADEKDRYDAMENEKNATIEAMQHEVDDLMKQLQDIMEENVRLDMEIATFRNLIEGEESR